MFRSNESSLTDLKDSTSYVIALSFKENIDKREILSRVSGLFVINRLATESITQMLLERQSVK